MSRPEDDKGGFLGRWARRKQEVQLHPREQPSGMAETEKTTTALSEAQAAPVTSDGENKELPLPSLDDVLPGGDVSVFLQKHVPDALRNAALRKAWLADPEISGFIEMADYQWDFTKPDSIPGWSSTLEGFDVKAMIGKLFNNVAPPQEQDLKILAEDVPVAENQNAASGENIIMDAKSSEKPLDFRGKSLDADVAANDIAVQESTMDSGGYGSTKKRHGSALPT